MKIHLRFLGNSIPGQVIRALIMLVVLIMSSVAAFIAGIFSLNKDSTTRLKTIMPIVRFFSCAMHDFLIGKIILKGEENLHRNKGPLIFVSNHESYWDAITMPVILTPTVFTVKGYVMFLPFAGWAIAMTPVIKIDSGFGWRRKDRQMVIELSKNELRKGNNILFYSQGTRVRDGSRVPFKKGAARLALETNTPVLPIATNSINIWPGIFFTKTGDVTISFGKPIYPEGKTEEELTEELENWVYKERSLLD